MTLLTVADAARILRVSSDVGELALRVIDEKIENIDASIAQRVEQGMGCDSVKAARRSWTQRRLEIEYAMVLLRGGASPLEAENAELRAKVAGFNKRIEDLNAVIHDQRERLKVLNDKYNAAIGGAKARA